MTLLAETVKELQADEYSETFWFVHIIRPSLICDMKAICIFSIFLLEIILIAYPRYLWLTDNNLGQNIKYKIQENKKGIPIVENNIQRSNKLNTDACIN